jgi:hypothetical protein
MKGYKYTIKGYKYTIKKNEPTKKELNLQNYDSIKKIREITIRRERGYQAEIYTKYVFYVNRLEYVADVLLYYDILKKAATRQPGFIKVNWI